MRRSQFFFPVVRIAIAGVCVACSLPLLADFHYQETTQITGGSIVGLMKMAGTFSAQARKADQPVTSTVLLKGDRMARIRPDSAEIIDLDHETITQIDNAKRQYTVTTFEQMRQQIQQAEQDAKAKQAQAGGNKSAPPPDNVDTSFDVHVRETGATKQVSGQDTKEAILTMALVAKDKTTQQTGALGITNDMWLAPEIAGYDEMRAFNEKFAKKMGRVFSGTDSFSALMAQPGAAKGMAGLATEISKLKGVPVMQVMRMGSTADGQPLPAASEAPLPAAVTPAMPSAGDVAQQTATSMIANKLGGLGALGGGFSGFGKRKKAEVKQDASDTADQAGNTVASTATTKEQGSGKNVSAANVLIESRTTMGEFSTDPIDASRFDVPTGYQQVTADAKHRGESM